MQLRNSNGRVSRLDDPDPVARVAYAGPLTVLVDRFSALDGVARVRVGGAQTYAMRLWLDRKEMAARGITVGR